MGSLKVLTGSGAGLLVDVDRELVIGRESADVSIDDDEMSRRHASVRPVRDGVAICDLGSLNGTFVNGQRIAEEVTLTVSGTLRVGLTEIAVELPTSAGATVLRDQPLATPQATVVRPAAIAPQAPPGPPPTPYGGPPDGHRPPAVAMLLRSPGVVLPAALLLAAAIVAVVLLATGSSSAKNHLMSGTLHGGLLSATQSSFTFGGAVSQTPSGSGSFTGTLTVLADPRTLKPVPMTGIVVERFDAGRINLSLRGTVQFLVPDGSMRIVMGVATISGGNGLYKHATGRASFIARADVATQGNFSLQGTIRY